MSVNGDYFARPAGKSHSPFELNNEGKGQALVLRYAGCNLRCPLCYAWRYAWFPSRNGHQYGIQETVTALNNLADVVKKKIVWVRIQGGEPCLNYFRILNTITFASQALVIIHQLGLNHYDRTRAIIQTNGIVFSTLSVTQIENIRNGLRNLLAPLDKGKVIFEVSFKSLNNREVLNKQLVGLKILLRQIIIPLWENGLNNIAVYPIAGLGPSIDFHNTWLIPVDPSFLPQEVPLFHPSTWSSSFRSMFRDFVQNIVPNYNAYRDFRENPRANNGKRIAIEELEPTQFQTSWISGYAGGYGELNVEVVPIANVLRKLNDNPDPQWFALFKRNNRWLNVPNNVPISSEPRKLLKMVKDMNDTFYPSHPVGHYPYL